MVLVIALSLGVPVRARAQGEITLLAPSPTRKPLDRILQNFQAKGGHKVKVTYSGARTTTQSVAKGDALDVSLVVAPVTGPLTSGAVNPSSMTLVASYQTALIVPKGAPKPDISSAAAVKKALLAAKAIGYEDPDFTVAGQGPLEALTKLGITEQVASKSEVELGPGAQGISPEATRNTVKTATRLANGDIDIGMLMLSDMLPEKDKYDIVGVLPRNVTAPVSVVGFISAHASDPAGAKALLDYLASSDAQAVWKEAGYGPPER